MQYGSARYSCQQWILEHVGFGWIDLNKGSGHEGRVGIVNVHGMQQALLWFFFLSYFLCNTYYVDVS